MSVGASGMPFQAMFCRFVSTETIVVGHSLENDLIAMEIFHDRVIDTTMIYPHPAGFPRRTSLKARPLPHPLHSCNLVFPLASCKRLLEQSHPGRSTRFDY